MHIFLQTAFWGPAAWNFLPRSRVTYVESEVNRCTAPNVERKFRRIRSFAADAGTGWRMLPFQPPYRGQACPALPSCLPKDHASPNI